MGMFVNGVRRCAALAGAGLLTLGLCAGCAPGVDEASSTEGSAASSASSSASSAAVEVSSEANRDAKFEDIPDTAVISADELHTMLDSVDAPFVVDVRAAGISRDAFIEGSKNIPAGRQIDMRLSEIPTDKTLVLVSSKTSRLAEVRQTLIDAGYNPSSILVLGDGMEAWVEAGYPTGHRETMGC